MPEFLPARVEGEARTLPGRYYVSEEVFREETERLFYGGWVCVGRAEEIPQPGDYRAVALGTESLLVVRGEDGTARAFYNVCRHRGSRLCMEHQGRFPGRIQCPYHAWTYSLDGELKAAPHMREVAGFERAEYPLYGAALEEWAGFLWINLAPQPEPFERAFAPVLRRFAAWDMPALRCARRIDYRVQANWKLLVENYSECYHCPLVHPQLVKLSPANSGRNDLLEGPFLGGYMDFQHGVGSMTVTGHTARPPVGSISGEDLSRVYYYALFPNLLLSLHPDYVMAHVLWPEAPGRTRVVCEWLFDPATMAQPDFDPSDAVEFWDLTNRQDWSLCEQTQLGVGSRAAVPGPYANQEGLPWAFNREYLRRMG